MALDDYLRRTLAGQTRGPVPALVRTAAAAVEPAYAAVVSLRNRLYDRGNLASYPLGRPVISVGNLSAGGTGKTPVVAYLARALAASGHRPAVLMRGYRKSPHNPGGGGDEQLELRAATGLPVLADPDRVAAAKAHLRDHPDTTAFILDDGFQHRRVRRDLDVVLVSATQGLCGGRVLPRGLLREPIANLARSDVLVVTRADQVDPAALDALTLDLRRLAPGVPVLRCTHAPTEVTTSRHERLAPAALAGRRLFAVTATGDPRAFILTLRALGPELTGHRLYADHHPYTAADLAHVHRLARAAGSDGLVTTAKDAVKLTPLLTEADLPLHTLHIAARFPDDDADRLLSMAGAALKGA